MVDERCYDVEEAALLWKKWRIHLFEYIDPYALNEKELTIRTWIGANDKNWEEHKYKNSQVISKLKGEGIKIERQRQTAIRQGSKILVPSDPISKICKPSPPILQRKLRGLAHVGAGMLLNTQRSADFNEIQINVPLEAISYMKDKKEAKPEELIAIGKQIIEQVKLLAQEKEEEKQKILGLLQQELSLSPRLIEAEEKRKENLKIKGATDKIIEDEYQKRCDEIRGKKE